MILFVNACPRAESRTKRLADALLKRLGEYTEVDLYAEELPPVNRERLARREKLLRSGNTEHPMLRFAVQFAAADEIVIAAPYWDLSFPAKLKCYIENIYAVGIVTRYDADGIPHGLCRARKLWYVTTAGGPYDARFSYGYLQELSTQYFGIPQTGLIYAECLDIAGNDPEGILAAAFSEIEQLSIDGV